MAEHASRRDGDMGVTFFGIDLDTYAERTRRRRRSQIKLKIPEGKRKPDSFYEHVAYR